MSLEVAATAALLTGSSFAERQSILSTRCAWHNKTVERPWEVWGTRSHTLAFGGLMSAFVVRPAER